MAQGKGDQFANVAWGMVTQSAANTLTFSQIVMGVSVSQKMAMVLHRVLWMPAVAYVAELVAATDRIYFALTSNNRLSGISDLTEPALIASMDLIGCGANVELIRRPFISDYTMLPRGGKLIPPNPLWLATHSAGCVSAGTLRVQIEFTWLELSDADYLELLQAVYPANVA